MSESYIVSTFYIFTPIPEYEAMKDPLLDFCNSKNMKGSILLAEEGMNATVSGLREELDAFYAHLRSDPRFADMWFKESTHEVQPFMRMKVRLKREIVAMGTPGLDVNGKRGAYVKPQDWDDLITSPDVITIDTRNHYEVNVGTFEGAMDPHTTAFREFPAWAESNLDPKKHKRVAMFCTGGVRCEKSTAYLREKGFDEVYHLEGGILEYLRTTGNKNNKWKGDCFVFDDRVAVDKHLEPSGAVICPGCGEPVTTDAIKLGEVEYGVRCRNCATPLPSAA